MAPRTRSAQNPTAVKKESSPPTSARRPPRCKNCGRPRAGHPRSGCPFAATPAPEAVEAKPVQASGSLGVSSSRSRSTRRRLSPAEDVSDALRSLQVRTSPPGEAEAVDRDVALERRRKARAPASRSSTPGLRKTDTLISLSSTSHAIVDALLVRGVVEARDNSNDDTEPEDENGAATPTGRMEIAPGKSARIVRWQESLIAAATSNARKSDRPRSSRSSPMPGTLVTPNASFFDFSSGNLGAGPSRAPIINVAPPTEASCSLTPTNPSASPKGQKTLARTMSHEQRELFISRLGAASRATIYILPKADIHEIADAARLVHLFASVVTNADEEDDQSLLIIGKREGDVKKLLSRVQQAEQSNTAATGARAQTPTSPAPSGMEYTPEKPRSTTSYALTAAAGGAVVGAVGAWAGLAFA